MYERSLIFSSTIATSKNSQNTPDNFTVQFGKRLELPPYKTYKVALQKLQSTYSWHNIEASRGNNQVRYSMDAGTTWKTITFNNGTYSYSDMNEYIHTVMKINGDYTTVSSVDVFAVNLSFSLSTFKVNFHIDVGCKFDIFSVGFGTLIGFPAGGILTGSLSVISSTTLPDITNSIDNIYVHCSMVMDSVIDGFAGDVLFTYSTDTLTRSYSYSMEPYNMIFNRINGTAIDNVTFRTTDLYGRGINFNGIGVTYTLLIREDS